MTPSDDLFPPRRPIFFPVVIATVFLTIIGMTAGFVLGERHRDNLRASQASETVDTPTTEPETNPSPSDKLCPEATRKTAESLGLPSDLRQIFKVVTANGTTVWICEDPGGSLYYQGLTGGVDATLVQGDNGLFLSQVVRTGNPDEYEATANEGNRFLVNRRLLRVEFQNGKPTQVFKVVRQE